RPSPGAETPERQGILEQFSALELAKLAAPEDGRTPLNKYGRLVLNPHVSQPSDWTDVLSLTPCFSGVFGSHDEQNRFNGLPHAGETVETVPIATSSLFTQLKQGVNEKGVKTG
ncbi:MAG: hypothetical protein AAB466_04830, partial [Verrucomicrobiota bacterium]